MTYGGGNQQVLAAQIVLLCVLVSGGLAGSIPENPRPSGEENVTVSRGLAA